jgi:PncC family amidohydrolase
MSSNTDTVEKCPIQVIDKLIDKSHTLAYKLLQELKSRNMKIMTVESMTGGLIISTLTDIPGFSDNIYGSYVLYNTLAKKEVLNLDITNGIYNEEFVRQMCCGSVDKSVDIIIAISGNACPETGIELGVFHIGIVLKLASDHYKIFSKKINIDISSISNLIADYESSDDPQNKLFRSFQIRHFIKESAIEHIFEETITYLNNMKKI